jgi:hypothetical protein
LRHRDPQGSVTSASARATERRLRAGFFIGALGPNRVAALVKGEIERPSDFDGVVYISLDDADWQMRLGRELQAACVGAGDLGLARLKAAFSEARPT